MPKVLLFEEAEIMSKDSLFHQMNEKEMTLILVRSILELEQALFTHRIDLLIVHLSLKLSTEIYYLLSKSKNISHLRSLGIFFIFRHYYPKAFRMSLLLGAKSISIWPIDKRSYLNEVKYYLSSKKTHLPKSLDLESIIPVSSKNIIFGRIGKISIKSAEKEVSFFVETNAKLNQGDTLNLKTPIASTLLRDYLKVEVVHKSEKDIYYNYAHSYQLRWITVNLEDQILLEHFIEQNKQEFSLPKIKVLFLTDQENLLIEECFNQEIFSLYIVTKKELDRTYLNRIAPKVIVLNINDLASLDFLLDFINFEPQLMVIQTNQNITLKKHSELYHLSLDNLENFKEQFNKIVHQDFKSSVQNALKSFYFISRKSNYSRFSLSIPGFILSYSQTHFKILSDMDMELETIIEINSDYLILSEEQSLFIKILGSTFDKKQKKYILEGEVLPKTNSSLNKIEVKSISKFNYKMNSSNLKIGNLKDKNYTLNKIKKNFFFILIIILISVLFLTVILNWPKRKSYQEEPSSIHQKDSSILLEPLEDLKEGFNR